MKFYINVYFDNENGRTGRRFLRHTAEAADSRQFILLIYFILFQLIRFYLNLCVCFVSFGVSFRHITRKFTKLFGLRICTPNRQCMHFQFE